MSQLQPAFLKSIMIDEKFSYIDDLDPRWFSGDDLFIFKLCAYLYVTKKYCSYEQVKGHIEVMKDINDYKRQDLLSRLKHIKEGMFILPPDEPIAMIRRSYEDKEIALALTEIPKLEHENKIALIQKLAEKLKADVGDNNTSIMEKEIDLFADDLLDGKANILTGGLKIRCDYSRGENIVQRSNRWCNIFRSDFISPDPIIIMGREGDYKTAFLIDLMVLLSYQGYRGLHLSFEDSKIKLRPKFISNIFGEDKKRLQQVNKDIELGKRIKKENNKDSDKIIVHDAPVDYDKFESVIDSYCAKYKIDYYSIDYAQLISGKQSQKDKLDHLSTKMLEVCNKHHIAGFVLSQATTNDTDKAAADSRLHKKHVADSKKLANTARTIFCLYGDNQTEVRNLNVDKHTVSAPYETGVRFEGSTGRLMEVGNHLMI